MGSIRAAAVTGSPVTRLHQHAQPSELSLASATSISAGRAPIALGLGPASLLVEPTFDRPASGPRGPADAHRPGCLVDAGRQALPRQGAVPPLRPAVLSGHPQRVAQDVAG